MGAAAAAATRRERGRGRARARPRRARPARAAMADDVGELPAELAGLPVEELGPS